MKNVHRILFVAALFFTINARAQDSTGLTGTPIKEVQYTSDNSPDLTQEWYRGLVRDKSGKPYD
ncbi:MAG: hypothetical protein ABIN24_03435, partial [Dyadobacter sp.]